MNYLIKVDVENHRTGEKKTYDFWGTNRVSVEQKIQRFRRNPQNVNIEVKSLHYEGYQDED